MIIIKFLSTTGVEICEHHFDSDSFEEAETFVHTHLSDDTIFASANNNTVHTVFKSEHVAGYKFTLRKPANVVPKPF